MTDARPDSGGPRDGSKLCLSCGICCQGVLHDYVMVEEDELREVEGLRLEVYRRKEGLVFDLPCRHQDADAKTCGVYGTRPSTCREYRCKLLNRFLGGDIELEEALGRSRRALEMIDSLLQRMGLSETRELWPGVREHLATDDPDPEALLDVAASRAYLGAHFKNRLEPNVVTP